MGELTASAYHIGPQRRALFILEQTRQSAVALRSMTQTTPECTEKRPQSGGSSCMESYNKVHSASKSLPRTGKTVETRSLQNKNLVSSLSSPVVVTLMNTSIFARKFVMPHEPSTGHGGFIAWEACFSVCNLTCSRGAGQLTERSTTSFCPSDQVPIQYRDLPLSTEKRSCVKLLDLLPLLRHLESPQHSRIFFRCIHESYIGPNTPP
jgi:hypothetical protein